jgi:hypothetical protein
VRTSYYTKLASDGIYTHDRVKWYSSQRNYRYAETNKKKKTYALTEQIIDQKITGHINSMAQSPHEKLAAAHLVKKLLYFMEHDGSLSCSNSSPPLPRMWSIINPVYTSHPSVFISMLLQHHLLYAPKRTTCPTHYIPPYLIILAIISGKE